MKLENDIATIAKIIGDKTRAAILVALMEGRALTAGELALRANISPQTASNHLKKLTDAGLIQLIKLQARHRYYKITSPLVAKAIESLGVLTPTIKQKPPRHQQFHKDICFARSCYDHLAGELGVKMTQALLTKKLIISKDENFTVTSSGIKFFNMLDINYEALIKLRRPIVKPCLDWTEREYHIAGSIGKAVLSYLIDNRLVIRSRNKPRVLVLTQKGVLWFKKKLGIRL